MRRRLEDRVEDVQRIVLAARDLAASRGEGLSEALVRSTGLSREGVERVFERHLELAPSEDDVARLVARAGDADAVTVVLSANVFSGALRAISLARAAASDVVVRPSRRESVFARALVDAVRRRGDANVRLDPSLDLRSVASGEIHVYGRDATIAAVRRDARVPVRGHGSGMGVAWISSRADLDASSGLLGGDVVAFDQRGCLSPRIAVVVGPPARAEAFAERLHAHLEALAAAVPRGVVPEDAAAEIARYVTTMTVANRALVGASHAVGIAPPGAPLVLPPSYRNVHVAHVSSVDEGRALLAPWARGIVAFGSDDPEDARSVAPPWARLSPLGAMQTPPFDGPVDGRVS